MEKVSIGSALGLSVLGLCIVFIVLVLLMTIIFVMSKIISATSKKSGTKAAPAVAAAAGKSEPAVGSCGSLTLHKVSERDAAMVMAIVADQLKTPLNELRFISIKEVK